MVGLTNELFTVTEFDQNRYAELSKGGLSVLAFLILQLVVSTRFAILSAPKVTSSKNWTNHNMNGGPKENTHPSNIWVPAPRKVLLLAIGPGRGG